MREEPQSRTEGELAKRRKGDTLKKCDLPPHCEMKAP